MSYPSHRGEQTGSALLDRLQANVRSLIFDVRAVIARVVATEDAHGVGHAAVLMRDANYTLTVDEMACATIEFSGTHTGTRVATLRDATSDTAYVRWFTNATGQIVTVRTKDGTANIASAATRCIRVTGAGPAFLT